MSRFLVYFFVYPHSVGAVERYIRSCINIQMNAPEAIE